MSGGGGNVQAKCQGVGDHNRLGVMRGQGYDEGGGI